MPGAIEVNLSVSVAAVNGTPASRRDGERRPDWRVCASGVDAFEPGGFFGVCREGFVRLEPQVALGGKAQLATHGGDSREPNGTEFRVAPAEVIKTVSDIVIVRIDFRQKPGTACIGSKELHDRLEVDFIRGSAYWSLLAAVFQKAGLNI